MAEEWAFDSRQGQDVSSSQHADLMSGLSCLAENGHRGLLRQGRGVQLMPPRAQPDSAELHHQSHTCTRHCAELHHQSHTCTRHCVELHHQSHTCTRHCAELHHKSHTCTRHCAELHHQSHTCTRHCAELHIGTGVALPAFGAIWIRHPL
jgi:hypothetical protein